MATVRITRYEARNNLLPPVCVVTGEPTGETKRRTFYWTPPWVIVFVFLVVLPYVIAGLVMRKTITLDVPIVSRKRGHWLVRQLFALFGILGCIGLVIVGIVLSNAPNQRNQGPDFGLYTALAAGLGLVVVVIVSLLLQNTSVRPSEITDDDITLKGVHENFVVALEEERDREEDEREERRAAKRERGPAPRRDRDRDADDEPPRRARRIRDDD